MFIEMITFYPFFFFTCSSNLLVTIQKSMYSIPTINIFVEILRSLYVVLKPAKLIVSIVFEHRNRASIQVQLKSVVLMVRFLNYESSNL